MLAQLPPDSGFLEISQPSAASEMPSVEGSSPGFSFACVLSVILPGPWKAGLVSYHDRRLT